jgi:hypothetical protein
MQKDTIMLNPKISANHAHISAMYKKVMSALHDDSSGDIPNYAIIYGTVVMVCAVITGVSKDTYGIEYDTFMKTLGDDVLNALHVSDSSQH